QVLYRFFLLGDGGQVHQRRPNGGARLVSPGRSLGERRRDHGDARRGGLPDAGKAGYGRNAAGGLLAAGGLGAIISPPVLGAAAFLIAEFLKISYLDVLLMATIPTCLYYFALYLMVEIDARKFGMSTVKYVQVESLWRLRMY